MPTLILLNASANHGRAHRRWPAVRRALQAAGQTFDVQVTRRAPNADDLERYWDKGYTTLVAAGGDGTANGLLNTLMDSSRNEVRRPFAVGAIGLGSSNDFHKPTKAGADVAGYPVRLDVAASRPIDLGKVVSTGPDGEGVHYFAINASFGATALGNHLFNNPGRLLAWAKPRNVDLALGIGALQALGRSRPVPLQIRIDEPQFYVGEFEVNNLGILKNIHFTGSLRYDTPVRADDGHFDVNLLAGQSRASLVRSLINLARGRFLGTHGAQHWRATRLTVTAKTPVPMETDGEVRLVTKAQFEVIPSVVQLCGIGLG